MGNRTEYLKTLYYDIGRESGLSSVEKLYRAVKLEGKYKISRNQIKDFLHGQDAYTLHKPARKKYPRNRILAVGPDEIHQLDLVDVSNLSKYNNGYKYLLTWIDLFSKYAWVIPLKNKTGKVLVEAVKKNLKSSRRTPIMIHTDKGSEFTNREFQSFLKSEGIHFYTTNSEVKASVVERFNRTLKSRMWRYFTHKNTRQYTNVLQRLVTAYNKSYHRSIKMQPVEVTGENESLAWKNIYSRPNKTIKFKLEVNDRVRVSKQRLQFEKSYLPAWSDEIFTVASRRMGQTRPVYKLKDYSDEDIQGSFYEEELQKVRKTDDLYRVERVIRQRKRNGKTEYFVKWLGYPSKFNSWVTDLH